MILLAIISLAACGTEVSPQTTAPTPDAAETELPANIPTQTALSSPTALPPTNTPEPTAAQPTISAPVAIDDIPFTRFSETAVNLYFSHPEDWFVETETVGEETVYFIASNEALLDGLNVGESGGVVRIAIEDTEKWIDTVKDQRRPLEGLVALYESVAGDNIDIIQSPISYRINGLEAATTSFYMNDEDRFMSLTFILSGDQSVTVISQVSADEEAVYGPILEAITESIYVPEEFVAHQIATRPLPFLFRYPVSWDWRPVDDNRIVLGPYEVTITGELGDEAMHVIDWADLGEMVPPQDMLVILGVPFEGVERGDVIWETTSFTINGQEAAQIVYNGRYLDDDVVLIYTVIAVEPYMIATYGITAVDNLNISIPIHVAINDSIVLQEGLVDFADPGSVVGAVFTAAQTGNFGILPYLCDPRGEADADVADICSINSNHERRDEFIEFFANAEISGEIVIDGYSAFVPFVFGPKKEQTETIELVRRNQLWYLFGY